MANKITVTFGSQHIAIPEPVSFVFETENEIITKVDVDVGYVHRGIEQAAVTKFKYTNVHYLLARVCGFCSITHAGAYVHAVEKLIGVETTKKIDYLRTLVVELDRIHSHLLANGHVAEVCGYENLFMQTVKYRESCMKLLEDITGNRVQYDYYTIGGVSRDLTTEIEKSIKNTLNELRKNTIKLMEFFETDYTLGLKTRNIGKITTDFAKKMNCVGPIARASGLKTDARAEFDFLPYEELGYKTQLRSEGDVWARNMVRFDEVLNSIEICLNVVDGLDEGDVKVKVRGKPKGETFIRVEAPRGECFYYLKGNGTNIMERVRIRVPTYANVPVLRELFVGSKYSDAQAIVLSFDPCLSCTAR